MANNITQYHKNKDSKDWLLNKTRGYGFIPKSCEKMFMDFIDNNKFPTLDSFNGITKQELSDVYNIIGALAMLHDEKQQAEKYLKLALKTFENNVYATNNLALLIGVRSDPTQVKQLFTKASNLGLHTAMNNLGSIYLTQSDHLNSKKAEEYFLMAANPNCDAMLKYIDENYRDSDKLEIKKEYQISVLVVNSFAYRNLGAMYYYPGTTFQDRKMSLHYFIKAFNGGLLDCSQILQKNYIENVLGGITTDVPQEIMLATTRLAKFDCQMYKVFAQLAKAINAVPKVPDEQIKKEFLVAICKTYTLDDKDDVNDVD